MNSRCRSFDNTIKLLVHPDKAPHVVDCLEGTALCDDGSGKIHKVGGDPLTHLSDGIGYYVAEEYPIETDVAGVQSFSGV